jgi:methionyl-tRNA formyltransferase
LIIEELQIEGKRRMKSEEFIAGHKINIGEMLGKK